MGTATGKVISSTTPWGDDKIKRPLAATAGTYYPGAMIALDASGNATKCLDSSGLKFEGLNFETQNLTVASGDAAGLQSITVERPFRIQMAIAAAAAGDEGKKVYAVDDQTVGYTSSNSILVGFVDQVLSATAVSIIPLYSPLNPVAVSNNTLAFTGATGVDQITFPNSLADALTFAQGATAFLTFNTSANTIIVKQGLVLTDAITITNSANATGTSLWGASDKGAFFGATPVVQPANTVDYITNLTSLGLRASGGTAAATFPGLVTGLSFLASSPTSGGVGYKTGAGGAVTQITSRTTGVTTNTLAGAITLVSAAGSATAFTMTVTNSAVAALDTVVVSQKSGTDAYSAVVSAVAAGSFKLTITDLTGTTTEQPVFNFAVFKSVAS